jgi:hypothetical protein
MRVVDHHLVADAARRIVVLEPVALRELAKLDTAQCRFDVRRRLMMLDHQEQLPRDRTRAASLREARFNRASMRFDEAW